MIQIFVFSLVKSGRIDYEIIATELQDASNEFIKYLNGELDVKVFSSLNYLGMEIFQEWARLRVYQKKNLKKFNMQDFA